MADLVSVCIATFRRPERLHLLLSDLARQSRLPAQVVVVDNDLVGSARDVVNDFRVQSPFSIVYAVEPLRGIARARNRTIALAEGDWLAFIDDDERAPTQWLERMVGAARSYDADGILAPVVPQLPEASPRWLQRGCFYDFPRHSSGSPVPPNYLRFGNVLLHGQFVRAEPGPFDPGYGLVTGEDGDMLLRLRARGARIVWCDEAPVYEPVEPARLSLHWLVQRSYSRGQEFGRKTLADRYGPMTPSKRCAFFADCLAKTFIATATAAVALPFRTHLGVRWLLRGAANLGKLTAFLGWRYAEYQDASASSLEAANGPMD